MAVGLIIVNTDADGVADADAAAFVVVLADVVATLDAQLAA